MGEGGRVGGGPGLHTLTQWSDLVSSDVELPLASVCVALEQHGAHAEDLLHHRVLPQVVLTLCRQGGGHTLQLSSLSLNVLLLPWFERQLDENLQV